MKSRDKHIIPNHEHVASMYRRTHKRRHLAFAVVAVLTLTALAAQARAATPSATSWNYTAELSLGTSAASEDALGYVGADLSSDGHTAIVGDLDRTVGGRSEAGAAARQRDMAACDVALSADGNTALVGIPNRAVDGQSQTGAAAVYRFVDGRWSKAALLTLGRSAHGGTYPDRFGGSVALSRDGTMAAIGVPNRRVNGKRTAGAIEVFRFNGSWGSPTELSLGSHARSNQYLGESVAVGGAGRVVLAGAPHGWQGRNRGEAFVFRRGQSGWSSPTPLILGPAGHPGDGFGSSVALSDDSNIALVVDPNRKHGMQSTSPGEVFEFRGGKWSPPTEIPHMGGAAPGRTARLSRDGETALLGGGPPVSTPNYTMAQVYSFGSGAWSLSATLTFGPMTDDQSVLDVVALSGDGKTALAGLPFRTINGKQAAGAAEVFTTTAGP